MTGDDDRPRKVRLRGSMDYEVPVLVGSWGVGVVAVASVGGVAG